MFWHFLLLLCAVRAEQLFCSNENSASGPGTSYTWQSTGWCASHCSGYDYAIVQGLMCWCSNSGPADSIDISSCDHYCPGYSLENCGSQQNNAYGYMYLGSQPQSAIIPPRKSSTTAQSSTPSSTSAASTSSTSTSSTSTSSTSSTSTSSTSSSSSSTSSTRSSSRTTLAPSTTSSSSRTRSSSEASDDYVLSTSMIYSVMTVTSTQTHDSAVQSNVTSVFSSNVITTKVVTSIISTVATVATTTTSQAANTSVASTAAGMRGSSNQGDVSEKKAKGYWQSPGKVAGTFVVVGVVILAILGLLFWYFVLRPRWEQKKFEKNYNDAVGLAPATPPNMPRNESGHSRIFSTPIFHTHHSSSEDDSSTGSNGAGYNEEKNLDEANVKTNKRATRHDVFADDAYSDYSNTIPVMVDQRLDPNQMMSQIEQSPSNVSLSDDVDYSRKVLRVINEL